jgi:FlaA1/EpsC-like NDP-sugar epimerase
VSKLVDVCDLNAFGSVLDEFRPDIVIHAAAYKHVPLAEDNPYQCARNNIQGTKNAIDLSIKYGVQKFVLISTDKAVRPTNIMGATKRVCELYVQNIKNAHKNSTTEIAAVRFGNVIGSSGSVIPKFKEQIAKGGPITVTHPEIERYFMLISEACELVLQAGAIAKGGEIFILDMGERVRIVDLAHKMLELSGKIGEINIEYCGLRPGEKLIEELLIDEKAGETKYPSIMVGKVTDYDINILCAQIEELLLSHDSVAEKLKQVVPEFKHNKNG